MKKRMLFCIVAALTWLSLGLRPTLSQTPEATTIEEARADNEKLYKKLKEWKSGKRDYKDAYVIMNFILTNYARMNMTASPKAEEIRKQVVALVIKHPDLKEMQELRLSEDYVQLKREQEKAERAKRQAASWEPKDVHPIRVIGSGNRAAVRYQFRLTFFNLPHEIALRIAPNGRLGLFRGNEQAGPSGLVAKKVITFKRNIDILPRFPDEVKENFLVCTLPWESFYTGMTPEEDLIINAKLGASSGSMVWRNRSGQFDNFCGVISLGGEIVYDFAVKQKRPRPLVHPLGITADGRKAAVMVGEEKSVDEEDGYRQIIGNPTEVIVWESGKKARHIMIKDRSLTARQLEGQFAQGKF